MKFEQWKDFNKGDWQSEINVRNFIQCSPRSLTERTLAF